MTTRKEKRKHWQQQIQKLQRLELQHHLNNEQEINTIHCPGCDICDQIRAIGEQLSSEKDIVKPAHIPGEPKRRVRKYPNTSLHGLLTVDEFWQYKTDGVSDSEICKIKNVSVKAMTKWKRDNEIIYQMSLKGMVK